MRALQGHPVLLERVLLRGHLATCVVAGLEPPLDLDLDVRPHVLGAANSLRVGNPDLDAEFQLGADAERAPAPRGRAASRALF